MEHVLKWCILNTFSSRNFNKSQNFEINLSAVGNLDTGNPQIQEISS